MIRKHFNLLFIFVILISSCSKNTSDSLGEDSRDYSLSEQGGSGGQNQPGVITAGEWNDLDNWDFWHKLIMTDEFKAMPSLWNFYNTNRIAIKLHTADNKPVINTLVKLKRAGTTIFTARTDNQGKAELWTDLFQTSSNIDYSTLSIDLNDGVKIVSNVKPYSEGINTIEFANTSMDNKIEIALVVDATGSMSDELEFLKTELLDVVSRIKTSNPTSSIYTSSVFYRDEGDEYVTRISNFSDNINTTIDFIKNQSANGGGDFPEAVHTALDKAINELQWSNSAKTRIMFLILDAPPHKSNDVITSIQNSIQKAAEKGVKIIPITASGIDKETEFLMRFIAMSTNGTYVFITDDSGVGNPHLTASVGEYQVELLNNLMVRLINKYAE